MSRFDCQVWLSLWTVYHDCHQGRHKLAYRRRDVPKPHFNEAARLFARAAGACRLRHVPPIAHVRRASDPSCDTAPQSGSHPPAPKRRFTRDSPLAFPKGAGAASRLLDLRRRAARGRGRFAALCRSRSGSSFYFLPDLRPRLRSFVCPGRGGSGSDLSWLASPPAGSGTASIPLTSDARDAWTTSALRTVAGTGACAGAATAMGAAVSGASDRTDNPSLFDSGVGSPSKAAGKKGDL